MTSPTGPTQGRLLDTYAARAGLRTARALAEALGVHPNSASLWLADARRIPADALGRCREVLVLGPEEVFALLAAGDRIPPRGSVRGAAVGALVRGGEE